MQQKQIAILVHDYFERSELEIPLTRLTDAGYEVEIVSASGDKSLQSMEHVELGSKFEAQHLIEECKPDDFEALILPGGVVNADKLRMNQDARNWVIEFIDTGKLLAAICHAPWLLVSADVLEERQLTSYYTLQDDIRNAGGEWTDRTVVVDKNLITSRNPDDLDNFCEAILTFMSDRS